MKVLVLSFNNTWIPHFETELEIISNHLDKNDDVYILTCKKKLKTCISNHAHLLSVCLKCWNRFCAGMKEVGVDHSKIFYLNKKLSKKLCNLLPKFFNSLDDLKAFKLFDIDFGLAVASTLISELRDHKFDTLLVKNKVYDNLYSALLVYESMLEIIDKIKPECIYIFNGRFTEFRPAIRVCEKLGINFYVHERGADITKFYLLKNFSGLELVDIKKEIENYWQNSLISEEDKKNTAEKWFKARTIGKDQEWVSFVKDQKKGLLPKNFDENKKNIAMFNSTSDEFECVLGWNRFIYKNDVEIVSKLTDAFKNNENYHFYLRVHPNLKNQNGSQIKELKMLNEAQIKNLTIIWPDEEIDSYSLLFNCDKVIVFSGSTIGVEACFWRKPVILLSFALYEDLNCCYVPKNNDHLIELVKSDLKAKDLIGALKYGFCEATKGIEFKKFEPNGFFGGTFLGKKIGKKLKWKDKLLLRLYSKIDNWNSGY
jgi:hypothetical protein